VYWCIAIGCLCIGFGLAFTLSGFFGIGRDQIGIFGIMTLVAIICRNCCTWHGHVNASSEPDVGLQYNRALHFDPTVGRLIDQDPIGYKTGDTNLYRCVGKGAVQRHGSDRRRNGDRSAL
jgi:RHS repeat-associated protein